MKSICFFQKCNFSISFKGLLRFSMLLVLSLISTHLYGLGFVPDLLLSDHIRILQSLSPSAIHVIIILCGVSAIVVTLLIILNNKRRIMTLELQAKTREIEQVNINLENLNTELLEQKEIIAKELVDSERLYSIILSSANDGIIFYNTDWTIKFANPALYSIIGYNQADLDKAISTKSYDSALHPDDAGYYERRKKAIEKDGSFDEEIKFKHKNGKYINISAKLVEVRDDTGTPIGILSILRNITSLKETQNQLIVAKEKAEEGNRLKSTFLANISHEIRTPLNSIMGFANLLNDKNNSEEVREEYIAYLNKNSERLLLIITDIIDLSRLVNSEIEIHYNPVRINSILDYFELYTADLIKKSEKDITLSVNRGLPDGRDVIYTDELWLKRVFRHLMDNAVKFTRSGSIQLSSALAGTSLMFTVKDTGIGISKDHLKTIFEQFRQEDNSHKRPFEGLGVGLTMARHVIDQMDGYVWVESEKGKGSEFFFTIPYRPVDGASVDNEKQEKDDIQIDWSDKTILIADDNMDILRYLIRVLADTGAKVIQAGTGLEVVQHVKETKKIDLILLDMQMPEMNGLDATREIREFNKDVPIIAQTAFIYEEEQDTLLKAGCDACLMKPIRQDHLITVVSNLLNNNR